MGLLTAISAAIRTRKRRFSGTSAWPRLVVNQAGVDCLNQAMRPPHVVGSLRRGESFYYYQTLESVQLAELRDDLIGASDLYVRLATTSSDLWEPEFVFVWGRSRQAGNVPLAMDFQLAQGLSTDPREGLLTIPVRRVFPGSGETPISRVLMVVVTYDAPYAGTDDPIWLRISTAAGQHLHHVITDTPQTDLEIDTANIYDIPVALPFTREALLADPEADVVLGIHGTDKWVPKKIFLFGLDRPSGPTDSVVPLVSLREPGPLSADPREGVPSIKLPLS